MHINRIAVYRTIDSRTQPTITAVINGEQASAPSGASTGSHEASSFVPDDLQEIQETLQARLEGREIDQATFDSELRDIDGTASFENIGSVGIACSLAFKKASGYGHGNTFPYPVGNVIGGGEHGGNTAIQEFLVIPVEAETFPEAVETNAAIYRELKERYSTKITGINDEGALITRMDDEKTLDSVHKVAEDHGARVGLDVAANEFWDGTDYRYGSMQMDLPPDQQLKFVQKLVDEYDLYYVEDPFHEDDFRNHQLLRRETDSLIVGDDLFVTQERRLQEGIDQGAGNAILIKPNQVGTVTDTRATVDLATDADYTCVISHRSGETCDVSISDLALEWSMPFIKAGVYGIRTAKLNRLLVQWQRMEQAGEHPSMAQIP